MSNSSFIAFFFFLLGACSQVVNSDEIEDQNRNTVTSYVNTIWNNKELDSLEVYFSGQFVRKVNDIDLAVNNAELTANTQVLFTAFPDLKMYIEEIISVENKVFMNWTITGTNLGVFGDHSATGKKIKFSGISRIDFNENGKITYENIYYNELSQLQQIGYKLLKPI